MNTFIFLIYNLLLDKLQEFEVLDKFKESVQRDIVDNPEYNLIRVIPKNYIWID